jgi:hypothetical protein
MTTIDTMGQAVQKLPAAEPTTPRSWFTQFDEAAWDAQIAADANAGRLDALAAEVLAEYQAGRAHKL